MSTYGKINDQGYLEYTIFSNIDQPHLVLLGDIPPAPQPGLSFHVARNQWEDLVSVTEKERIHGDAVLAHRAQLLKDSDWTDTVSASTRLGQELYEQWQTYRQALRDITDQSGYPVDITWPTAPQ